MTTRIEDSAPTSLHDADLQPRGPVHPSPADWRDQVFYFLLPDRFSDGQEASRPLYDSRDPQRHAARDKAAWMQAGKGWNGGTLRGIHSKLSYLRDLGVTTLWIGPIWKQRADLDTYHGYGIQNFLEVDPRFGTRQDLRDLVDAAHERGLYILLDIIYNHTGNNWFYAQDGQPANTMPYRYEPAYPVHSWRSGQGQPTSQIETLEDGVWPREFQNLDWYTRAGQIMRWDPASWENALHPQVEFRRGDFFDLKDLDLTRQDVIEAVVKVYQYWIALSDCDGFRIDTVKHIPFEASRDFSAAIKEYAESIGKERFLLLGEVTGGEYMAESYLDVFGRNLDAVLDIGAARGNLIGMTKGLADPSHFFGQFEPHNIMGNHRDTGRYHVTILDDHDMVGSDKRRYCAGNPLPTRELQVSHAVGTMLATLGMPCIYYGTEQAFDGSQSDHDFSIEPHLSFEDRYVREAMFGGSFGPFRTTGAHAFNPDHPVYLRIAALARLRARADKVGLALRRGRQYLREIADEGQGFRWPGQGELIAWSRIMHDREVLVVLNSSGVAEQSAWVTVDHRLTPIGSKATVLYRGDWPDERLRQPVLDEQVAVEDYQGRASVRLSLPAASMLILT